MDLKRATDTRRELACGAVDRARTIARDGKRRLAGKDNLSAAQCGRAY